MHLCMFTNSAHRAWFQYVRRVYTTAINFPCISILNIRDKYLMRQIRVHCTAVGGDQNKEFRGNASFLREKGQRGGIKTYCYCMFHFDQKAKNHMYSL